MWTEHFLGLDVYKSLKNSLARNKKILSKNGEKQSGIWVNKSENLVNDIWKDLKKDVLFVLEISVADHKAF